MQTETLWAIVAAPALLMVPLLWCFARETQRRACRLGCAVSAPSSVTRAWVEGQGADARLYARSQDAARATLAVGAEVDAACQRMAAAGVAVSQTT